jgi:manganese transport protein
VEELSEAHQLLNPILGTSVASTLFAVALLASGQSSTLTGTLAGQIVMEGFLELRLSPWLRRLLTRGLAVIPAVIVVALYGEKSTNKLLILSQVVLSLQLSFAVIPLVLFTGSRKRMGVFANSVWLQTAAWLVALTIAGLNIKFLWSFAFGTH